MTMATDYAMVWVLGDTAGALTGTLRLDGTPKNLDGATVTAEARHRNSGATVALVVTVTDAQQGAVSISGAERAKLTQPGEWEVRFRAAYAPGGVDYFPGDATEPRLLVRQPWSDPPT
jgi:hypothetical protein